jgi:hypothetical protein
MAHAYTPGLKVSENMVITKSRILPLKGDVLVEEGAIVEPEAVVARTELPGDVVPMNIANILNIPPNEVSNAMLKKEGDAIKEGEVIAESKSFFGLFKSQVKAKCTGSVESISKVTGQVMTRGVPLPVEVKGYITGKITKVIPKEGVEVVCQGTFIQGIFGICGEEHGELVIAVQDEKQILDASHINETQKEKIVVGGSLVTADAVRKAVEMGVRGIVAGGLEDKDLREFLGKDVGVAITGNEDLGVTLIITEGFGEIAMAKRTFDLLKKHEGKIASVNGATQIRAGVIRPEVIIPLERDLDKLKPEAETITGMDIGSRIRIIREPYFGHIGSVTNLPPELVKLGSESKARILEVKFDHDGSTAIVPRANVERIEE